MHLALSASSSCTFLMMKSVILTLLKLTLHSQTVLQPQMRRSGSHNNENVCFQQVVVIPHTSRVQWLLFVTCFQKWFSDIPNPKDLKICPHATFFCGAFFESGVYTLKLKTLMNLKDAIKQEVATRLWSCATGKSNERLQA